MISDIGFFHFSFLRLRYADFKLHKDNSLKAYIPISVYYKLFCGKFYYGTCKSWGTFEKIFFELLLPFFHNKFIEAGVDEVGRGCYAGPVYAAAVILQKDFYHPLLNDSKELTREERDLLRPIIEKECIAFSVASVNNVEIDRINILQASFKAMHLALNKLQPVPELLLIDGNRFKTYKRLPHQCIIKGDGIYASIAAASVLAKTYRDEYMESLHEKFQMYYWNKNKGYGTREHRNAIEIHGLCCYHRKSFNIWPDFENETINVIEIK